MNILITGSSGFIGFSLAKQLLKNKKNKVIGIDNLDSYYSLKLKKKRNKILKKNKNFIFKKIDLIDFKKIEKFLSNKKFDVIYHLAAQAGVRYTISNPNKYFSCNIIGHLNMLGILTRLKPKKFFFASSSSIYGDQKSYPLKENSKVFPKNIYGFSKYTNEIFSEFFSKNNKTKFIGLRFFTVFGEWGRPDMLIFKLLNHSLNKKKFILNDNGQHYRDFTYIDDVTKILIKLNKINYSKNFNVFNICSNNPKKVIKIVNYIKTKIGKINIKNKSSKILKKIEVFKTHGDNKKIKKLIKNFKFTKFEIALENSINWYLKHKIHKIT